MSRFMERLEPLGLLVSRDMQLNDATGKSVLVRGFRVVDDSRLGAGGGLAHALIRSCHRTVRV